jgi:uncharacterized repeat protein (TIGR03803 family)
MRLIAIAILTLIALAANAQAGAQQLKILHSFRGNSSDGASPETGVTFDKAGNLYGVTSASGEFNYGTVFEVSPKAGGGWTEKTLHNFNNNGKDGYYTLASLILDASGDLYSTSLYGGTNDLGIVYELIPQSGGKWAERILYNFAGTSTSGASPFGNPIFDSRGNLYGAAIQGGAGTTCGASPGCGVVYELTPKNGVWEEKVLYSFGVSGTDGFYPLGGLIFDAAGDLYGVTNGGGAYGAGMVFELVPGSGGTWSEKDLHDFNPSVLDGSEILAGLVFDKAGNLYGTTTQGGTYNQGTVYELTPAGQGNWTEAVIYSFGTNSNDGRNPYYCVPVVDAEGNLYGINTFGSGTVWELTPGSGGTWTETVLFNFTGASVLWPYGSVTLDGKGDIYATASGLGGYFVGAVFEIVP